MHQRARSQAPNLALQQDQEPRALKWAAVDEVGSHREPPCPMPSGPTLPESVVACVQRCLCTTMPAYNVACSNVSGADIPDAAWSPSVIGGAQPIGSMNRSSWDNLTPRQG